MNKTKNFSKDLTMVILSNILVLLSSVLTGFVIPKLLGVTEYGFYKIFALYIGYASFLHFGFVDGILLKYAGTSYELLDKRLFRSYSQFYILTQIIVSAVVIAITVLFLPLNLRILFFLLSIDIVFVNTTAYYQYVSQSTIRFKELSNRKVLQAILKAALVIGLFLLFKFNGSIITANVYTSGLVFIDFLLTLWYIFTYKDISFGDSYSLYDIKNDLYNLYKNGIIITISFQTAHLIFSLDRQFVSVLFDTNTYGIYAFAYNLISIVTTIIGATSLVLFPYLKTMVKEEVISSFSKAVSSLSIVSLASLLLYQPLCGFINWYLPDYTNSLHYLRILFPGLVLSSSISIIMFSYFRALDAHLIYFKICSLVLMISIVTNYGVIKTIGTPEAVSIASIFTLLIWFIVCQCYFVKHYHIGWLHNAVYCGVLILSFYVINYSITSMIITFSLYLFLYLFLTVLFYKDILISVLKRLRRSK